MELIQANKEWQKVLIAEDDISWTNDSKSINVFNKVIETNFDVLVLGGTSVIYNPFNYKLYECQTTTGYIVNRHYINILKSCWIEGLEKLEISNKYGIYGLDQFWKSLQMRDNWKIVYPPLFIQEEGYSDIEKKKINYKYSFYKVKEFENKKEYYSYLIIEKIIKSINISIKYIKYIFIINIFLLLKCYFI